MMAEIETRIAENVTELAGRISGVESLQKAALKARALECFVVMLGERAEPATSTGGAQKCVFRFAAMTAHPGGQGDARKTALAAGPLLEKIIGALLGWRHPRAIGATRYLETKVLGLSATGHLMNALEFEFDFYRSAA